MKSILFILSGNLSTTPRALKLIKLLSEKYSCAVLKVNRVSIWDKIDEELLTELEVESHSISVERTPFIPWLKATIVEKLSQMLYPMMKRNIDANAYASNKSSIMLWQYLKKRDKKVQLIIAHSAGSLYPAYKLGKKWHIPFLFDVEDYHPGEYIRNDATNEKKRREFLLKTLIPKAAAITYASPLIGKKTLELVSEQRIHKHLLINNSFYSNEFELSKNNAASNNSGIVRFVWFSQYIDAGRGLENIFSTMDRLQSQVELHLIGNLRIDYAKDQFEGRNYIHCHKTLNQVELHKRLSDFDVGLALEDNQRDLNRDLCLTNKIWAYAQAGLYVLATNTEAQRQFIKDYPWCGNVFKNNSHDLFAKFEAVIKNIYSIRQEKQKRFQKSREMGWENEGTKVANLVSGLIIN